MGDSWAIKMIREIIEYERSLVLEALMYFDRNKGQRVTEGIGRPICTIPEDYKWQLKQCSSIDDPNFVNLFRHAALTFEADKYLQRAADILGQKTAKGDQRRPDTRELQRVIDMATKDNIIPPIVSDYIERKRAGKVKSKGGVNKVLPDNSYFGDVEILRRIMSDNRKLFGHYESLTDKNAAEDPRLKEAATGLHHYGINGRQAREFYARHKEIFFDFWPSEGDDRQVAPPLSTTVRGAAGLHLNGPDKVLALYVNRGLPTTRESGFDFADILGINAYDKTKQNRTLLISLATALVTAPVRFKRNQPHRELTVFLERCINSAPARQDLHIIYKGRKGYSSFERDEVQNWLSNWNNRGQSPQIFTEHYRSDKTWFPQLHDQAITVGRQRLKPWHHKGVAFDMAETIVGLVRQCGKDSIPFSWSATACQLDDNRR